MTGASPFLASPLAAQGASFLRRAALAAVALLALAGCASTNEAPRYLDIALIGLNDLHGHLEPPRLAVTAPGAPGAAPVAVPAGGAAYLAGALATLKARSPHHAVVSAGDMVGASPLASALFLDEPTIAVVNRLQIDFNAVGNHEFDKGWRELLRLQHGGCDQHTPREPCQLSRPFAGANFGFLAANTLREDGQTLLPATGLKRFTEGGATVTLGFIGLTLKATPTMVTPAGVAGLRFADEAETANALIPQLRAQGADIIVVVIHEGGATTAGVDETSCAGLSGDIVPILERLDPGVDVVMSGHTHRAYLCDYGRVNPQRPLLLTSAGQYGTLLTDIALRFDTQARRLVHKQARHVIVQGEAFSTSQGRVELSPLYPVFAPDAQVQALVAQASAAAAPLAQRPVGQATGAILRKPAASLESALGNLVADAQLAATRAPDKGGAQISFMHAGGLRADLVPDAQGLVRYGQLFGVQPFGNHLVVKTFTGAQIRALLEQQFGGAASRSANARLLSVSEGLRYRYDLSRPPGARVSELTLHGTPLADAASYRVCISSYLADGGSNFSVFRDGRDALGGGQDIDALEAYFRAHSPVAPPPTDRITRL
ncbi:MAG: bifunctional metallophosphatase/5'-nucleotidase [Pseudomonadota bacterium]|nr:bifunctional metallophosphatase/5'-nucleotidase [Pseudomonadota bacterium]